MIREMNDISAVESPMGAKGKLDDKVIQNENINVHNLNSSVMNNTKNNRTSTSQGVCIAMAPKTTWNFNSDCLPDY
jgi:hypothetical protein